MQKSENCASSKDSRTDFVDWLIDWQNLSFEFDKSSFEGVDVADEADF